VIVGGHRAIVTGEKARVEEGDDRWGRAVSEREGKSARERADVAGGPRCWAEQARGRVASGPFGWAEPEEGRGVGPRGKFCFPFQKCE
jgi:sirohydrochlorin ferrochelatase